MTHICAAFVVGRYEEQVAWAEKMTEEAPNHPGGWRLLAAGYGLLGRQAQAQAAAKELLRVVPLSAQTAALKEAKSLLDEVG